MQQYNGEDEKMPSPKFNIHRTVLCNKQVRQLEKRLKERSDQEETGVPPVRGKWTTVNNPYEERYQSKLEGIQKERRAATEVSREFLTIFDICSKDYKCQKQHTHRRDP